MTIRAILFDIDGTLVDSNDLHVKAWDEAFRGIGIVIDPQSIHDQIGKGTDNLVPALVPDADEAMQEALGKAHGDAFKTRYLAQVKPFAGARDLLVRAHQDGRKVVLASSAAKDELQHYIELLDVRDIVAVTTSADDVENTKPAPDIFATALRKLPSLGADEVIVVGDTPYDIAAARKCGLRAIGVRSGGFTDADLRDAVALYDDAAALLAGYETSPLNE